MPTATTMDEPTALSRLRALVVADRSLTDALSAEEDGARFAARVTATAAAHGIAFSAERIEAALRPDPLGLSRWSAAPATGALWPPPQWLPVHVGAHDGRIVVDWAHFGTASLSEPFFEFSVRRVLRRPFNRLFRYRMTLEDFLARADGADSLTPNGFIFHMSRCGSTLAAQMLAAVPQHIVLSEAAPIDAMVRIGSAASEIAARRHPELLRAMVAAFGRKRAGDERHYAIKLDSWHALALPLFARAFSSTPWVFLYREPIDVLVSQMRERGTQMLPDMVPASLYGIDGSRGMPDDEYCARVLGRICAAAVAHLGAAGGIAVNYRDLPGAVRTAILPHFGIAAGGDELAFMERAARHDAKAPSFEFSSDTESKRRAATARLHALSERHIGAAYRQLETLKSF